MSNELRFTPTKDDPNVWGTDGHGHHPDALHHALAAALAYWPGDHPTTVPDTAAYQEGHVGLVDLEWRPYDPAGVTQERADQVKPVTWAILVPEEPQEEPDLDPVEFGDGRPDPWAVDVLPRFAAPFGRVLSMFDLYHGGEIEPDGAEDLLLADLRDVRAVTDEWIGALEGRTDGTA